LRALYHALGGGANSYDATHQILEFRESKALVNSFLEKRVAKGAEDKLEPQVFPRGLGISITAQRFTSATLEFPGTHTIHGSVVARFIG
jgi:hypothetical protein